MAPHKHAIILTPSKFLQIFVWRALLIPMRHRQGKIANGFSRWFLPDAYAKTGAELSRNSIFQKYFSQKYPSPVAVADALRLD